MKKPHILFSLFIIAALFYQCQTAKLSTANTTLSTEKESFLTAYDLSIATSAKPILNEASAIVYDKQKVLMAIDKDMPGTMTSVFAWSSVDDFLAEKMPENLTVKAFKSPSKYEDMAITPDGNWVFASTGFDRVKEGSKDWDNFNTVLYWAKGQESNPQVLALTDSATSSISLRPILSKIIASNNPDFPNGMPYFKIEGLAATNNHLYFGVREEGKKFDDFKYKCKIIRVSYSISLKGNTPNITLGDDWKMLNDFTPTSIDGSLLNPLGLSSIEYDPYHKRFYVLTSYEKGESLGAYLWTVTEEQLLNNEPYTLMKDAEGKPFVLTHKAEDITILSANKLLVICDDDRVITEINGQKRKPNQAAYYVLNVK